MHCRIISALIGGFALTLAVALNANASPITFSFSVTATSGPLDGITENGTFTYDSSSVIPGGVNDNTGLLTGLNFTWNGITYNQTTANTGFLEFDSSGNLTEAFFGDNCVASACTIAGGTNNWQLFAVPGETIHDFTYATPSTTDSFGGTVTTALSPIPEPSTLALVGVGVAGLMLVGARLRSRRTLFARLTSTAS
jgi:PEP-CTERM motif